MRDSLDETYAFLLNRGRSTTTERDDLISNRGRERRRSGSVPRLERERMHENMSDGRCHSAPASSRYNERLHTNANADRVTIASRGGGTARSGASRPMQRSETNARYMAKAEELIQQPTGAMQTKQAKREAKLKTLRNWQKLKLGLERGRESENTIGKLQTNTLQNEARIKAVEAEESGKAEQFDLPTVNELFNGGFGLFGRPSRDHSFTQEASGETILFPVMKYGRGFLDDSSIRNLRDTHPLVNHLWKMTVVYPSTNAFKQFVKLREYDTEYAKKKEIPADRLNMFLACLIHFDLDVANVMRYAGNNYTAGYRDVEGATARMRGLGIDEDLLTHYARIMLVGAPAHFVAEASREDAMLHWRMGNHSSILNDMEKTIKAMAKLVQHHFAIPLPSWIARFIPHIFSRRIIY